VDLLDCAFQGRHAGGRQLDRGIVLERYPLAETAHCIDMKFNVARHYSTSWGFKAEARVINLGHQATGLPAAVV
jgi:hypothetical protein